MKLSCLLLICLTNILLRVSAYVRVPNDMFIQPFILAVLLAFLLASLQNRRSFTRVTAVAASTTTAPQLRCSNGYTLYPGPGRSFCFRFSTDCKSWDDARTACQMERGDLAVLDNESLIPFSRSLEQNLRAAVDCAFPVAYLGAKIDDTTEARYINGQTIPKNSSIWFEGVVYVPNSYVGLTLINETVFLLHVPYNATLRYVCQQF